jgi:hypothetical protein
VLLGIGDGSFMAATSYGAGFFRASSVVLADLDGDHALDAVVGSN